MGGVGEVVALFKGNMSLKCVGLVACISLSKALFFNQNLGGLCVSFVPCTM